MKVEITGIEFTNDKGEKIVLTVTDAKSLYLQLHAIFSRASDEFSKVTYVPVPTQPIVIEKWPTYPVWPNVGPFYTGDPMPSVAYPILTCQCTEVE